MVSAPNRVAVGSTRGRMRTQRKRRKRERKRSRREIRAPSHFQTLLRPTEEKKILFSPGKDSPTPYSINFLPTQYHNRPHCKPMGMAWELRG